VDADAVPQRCCPQDLIHSEPQIDEKSSRFWHSSIEALLDVLDILNILGFVGVIFGVVSSRRLFHTHILTP
jgi:hypothetical protein